MLTTTQQQWLALQLISNVKHNLNVWKDIDLNPINACTILHILYAQNQITALTNEVSRLEIKYNTFKSVLLQQGKSWFSSGVYQRSDAAGLPDTFKCPKMRCKWIYATKNLHTTPLV